MRNVTRVLSLLCVVAGPQLVAQPVGGADPVRTTVFAPSLHIALDSARRLDSGTYVLDLVAGAGPAVALDRPATVQLEVWLPSGVQVQSTTPPETLRLNRGVFLPAVEKGIAGMQVGAKRRLILPPALAYGDLGSKGVPGNSVLIVDVTLVAQPH